MRKQPTDGIGHTSSDFLPRAGLANFTRASGACVCSQCGQRYDRHPHDPYEIDANGARWLTLLCDGTRVKL
jgi:hypothetical protein